MERKGGRSGGMKAMELVWREGWMGESMENPSKTTLPILNGL